MKWLKKGIPEYSDFLKKQGLTHSGTMILNKEPAFKPE
jgi:pSer/pThr/pTyr-binding forkhead associated (FHA) protein